MNEPTRLERDRRLESMLTDANRQLLERDRELFAAIDARDKELAQARKRLEWLDRELERHSRDIEELNHAIAEMQATRAWRLALRYRELRDRLKAISPVRKRGLSA